MDNVVALKRPPSDLAAHVREIADAVERGEITSLVCAYVRDDRYSFLHGASINNGIVLSTLLLDRSVARSKED